METATGNDFYERNGCIVRYFAWTVKQPFTWWCITYMPQIKVHHARGKKTNKPPRPHSEKKSVSWLTEHRVLLLKLIWGHYRYNFQEQTQGGCFISFTPPRFSRAKNPVLPLWQMPQPLLPLLTFNPYRGLDSKPSIHKHRLAILFHLNHQHFRGPRTPFSFFDKCHKPSFLC